MLPQPALHMRWEIPRPQSYTKFLPKELRARLWVSISASPAQPGDSVRAQRTCPGWLSGLECTLVDELFGVS